MKAKFVQDFKRGVSKDTMKLGESKYLDIFTNDDLQNKVEHQIYKEYPTELFANVEEDAFFDVLSKAANYNLDFKFWDGKVKEALFKNYYKKGHDFAFFIGEEVPEFLMHENNWDVFWVTRNKHIKLLTRPQ